MRVPLPYCQLGRAQGGRACSSSLASCSWISSDVVSLWCYSSQWAVGVAVLETEPQMQAEYNTFLANNHIIQCLSEEGVDQMPCSSRVAMTMAQDRRRAFIYLGER